ncbi:hypothetical protein TrCOL_g7171 [Triparma columacea]|uniref:Uncharacterized protein n=1 Tax=Triparma columacea TaxID=722753 RepID=A0A9W7G9P9_9STRA|nr:hypothetical protein TrCOL_g7171 [Triparma columacea]
MSNVEKLEKGEPVPVCEGYIITGAQDDNGRLVVVLEESDTIVLTPAAFIISTSSADEIIERFNNTELIQEPEQRWGILQNNDPFIPKTLTWATRIMFKLNTLHPNGLVGFPYFRQLCSYIKRNDVPCGWVAHPALKGRLGFVVFWTWASEHIPQLKAVFDEYGDSAVVPAANALAAADEARRTDRAKHVERLKKPTVATAVNRGLSRSAKQSHKFSQPPPKPTPAQIAKEAAAQKEKEFSSAKVALLVEATNKVAEKYGFNRLITLIELSVEKVLRTP